MVPALDVPVVGAPLAGGPSTPALAAAVSNAGGLGFVAGGYRTAEQLAGELRATRGLTARPIGVNLFVPSRPPVDDEALTSYAERLGPEAERLGCELGAPVWSDDAWEAKLEVVLDGRPAVVSFTFGCPARELVEAFQARGCSVWVTVTSVAEAREAAAAGTDALVVQGGEAGGHRGGFVDSDDEPTPLAALLADVRAAVDLPLVAAGGIADGRALARALDAGAVAAQIGTALLLTPEAGTGAAHRRALRTSESTALTRAFTGRTARGLVNRFLREHSDAAPRAYPHVHHLTAPLRAAARAAGDADVLNLWAGTAFRSAEGAPAGELVARWARDASAMLGT